MIYLDNAATTNPKPSSVILAVSRMMRDHSANPGRSGHSASVAAAQEVYRVRRNIADFFHLPNEENVIFTNNCTAAINTVVKGILRPGDHVVISSLEHNAVLRPLEQLRKKGVITYDIAAVGDTAEETIDSFRRAINSRTRMMICTHASNVFGTILPVRRLCALAHSYGVLFCLDAAQSAGVLPIDLADDGYDYVCCAGHKGLYGLMGTGLLLINTEILPEPLTAGGTGSESWDPSMPDYLPDRLESGTLNVPGIVGLSSGVDFVRRMGIAAIYQKDMGHIRFLHDQLRQIERVRLFTPYPKEMDYAPVLSFSIDGTDSETVASYLDRQYHIAVRAGLHCAPLAHRHYGSEQGGTVRIAPSAFTTRQEMQILINAVNKFAHLS